MVGLTHFSQTEFEALKKTYIPGFSVIADQYDVFIFDIFGTLCDGRMSVFQVQDVLQKLRFQNKKVVFFSNMPRPGAVGLRRLEEKGLLVQDFECYTSADHFLEAFPFMGKTFFHLGQERNMDLFHVLPAGMRLEDKIDRAEYVILTAFSDGDEDSYHAYILEQLKVAGQKQAIVVCINPDCEVTMPSLRHPPGYFAQHYIKYGGKVIFYGKPCRASFEWLLTKLAAQGYCDVHKMLMIGDNLSTDIEGGKSVNMDTAWVLSGVLPEQKTPFVMPTHVLNSVKW